MRCLCAFARCALQKARKCLPKAYGGGKQHSQMPPISIDEKLLAAALEKSHCAICSAASGVLRGALISQAATQPGCHTAYEPTLPLLLCSASRPILWTCQWLCGPAFPLFPRFSCPPYTCGREKSLGTFSISSFHHLRRTLPEIEISLPSTKPIFLHSQEMQPLRLQIFNSFK